MRSAELDGNLALRHLLTEAGYRNTTHAVAAHACYLHPATVAQAGKRAVLPVIRSGARRGRIDLTDDGRKVMLDDHRVSTWLFVRSTGVRTAPDVQVRHAWAAAGDPDANTALWNLHAVPGFLLDTLTGPERDAAADALRYRAWELYGRRPLGERKPCRPKGYKRLGFADPAEPLADLEAELRRALRSSPHTLVAGAVRQLGWCFSGFAPDPSI